MRDGHARVGNTGLDPVVAGEAVVGGIGHSSAIHLGFLRLPHR